MNPELFQFLQHKPLGVFLHPFRGQPYYHPDSTCCVTLMTYQNVIFLGGERHYENEVWLLQQQKQIGLSQGSSFFSWGHNHLSTVTAHKEDSSIKDQAYPVSAH